MCVCACECVCVCVMRLIFIYSVFLIEALVPGGPRLCRSMLLLFQLKLVIQLSLNTKHFNTLTTHSGAEGQTRRNHKHQLHD